MSKRYDPQGAWKRFQAEKEKFYEKTNERPDNLPPRSICGSYDPSRLGTPTIAKWQNRKGEYEVEKKN